MTSHQCLQLWIRLKFSSVYPCMDLVQSCQHRLCVWSVLHGHCREESAWLRKRNLVNCDVFKCWNVEFCLLYAVYYCSWKRADIALITVWFILQCSVIYDVFWQLCVLYFCRPYFTYWVTFVQIVCYIVSVAVYGFSPIGISVKIVESEVFDRTPSEYCNSFVLYNMLSMLSFKSLF